MHLYTLSSTITTTVNQRQTKYFLFAVSGYDPVPVITRVNRLPQQDNISLLGNAVGMARSTFTRGKSLPQHRPVLLSHTHTHMYARTHVHTHQHTHLQANSFETKHKDH